MLDRGLDFHSELLELRSCVKVKVAVLGFPSQSLHGLCGRKATLNSFPSELRSCVKVEVAVLVSPSLAVHSGGGCPGLPVPSSPCSLCGCRAAWHCQSAWNATFFVVRLALTGSFVFPQGLQQNSKQKRLKRMPV